MNLDWFLKLNIEDFFIIGFLITVFFILVFVLIIYCKKQNLKELKMGEEGE